MVKDSLKKKTENGHCHNPSHASTDSKPAWHIGSMFHKKLYNDFVQILEDFLKNGKRQQAYTDKASKLNV